MNPGAACGDPRVAPGIWRPAGMPGGVPRGAHVNGVGRDPGSPRPPKPINWWLWAISVANESPDPQNL